MAGALDFAGMVPGLDFLQTLMKGSAAASPPLAQWVAPTLDPAELEKRITELRTVQFWLEQNAKLLGASIQALEVQRMTLVTLQTMNLPMTDLHNALKIKPQAAEPAAAGSIFQAKAASPGAEASHQADSAAANAATAPAADPLQWWGALTQQFSEIAAKTLQQTAAEAAKRAPAAAFEAGAVASPAQQRSAAKAAAAPSTARPRRPSAR